MVDDCGNKLYDELTGEERTEFDKSWEILRELQFEWDSTGVWRCKRCVLSSPLREIRDEVYAPQTYYLKDDDNVPRKKQGKPDYADPLTISEAALVPNGIHVDPCGDPHTKTPHCELRARLYAISPFFSRTATATSAHATSLVRPERGAMHVGELVLQGRHGVAARARRQRCVRLRYQVLRLEVAAQPVDPAQLR